MESDKSQDELRAHLRAFSNKLPAALERLGNALWNIEDDPLTHAACQEALAQFIDAELAGDPVATLFPLVKHHLDSCNECSAEYAELLDVAWLEQLGTLAKPATMPRPNLSFLPQPKPSLPDLVRDISRVLMPLLAPAHLRDLNVIADTFFARVQKLGTFELRLGTGQAMGLGHRDTNPALNILAATYATSVSLATEFTRAEFDDRVQQNTLQQELETRALASARAIGIERELAARFAHAFAEQIVQEPEILRAQLK